VHTTALADGVSD